MVPPAISFLMSSAVLTPMRLGEIRDSDALLNVDDLLLPAISVICVFCPFLVGFRFLPRTGMVTRPQIRLSISCLVMPPSLSVVRFLPRSCSLFLVTSMSSRPRPSSSGTTLNSRTSPMAFLPGASGMLLCAVDEGVTRRTAISGRLMTTRLGGGGAPLALRAGGCGARTGRAAGAGPRRPGRWVTVWVAGPAAALGRGRPGASALGRGAGENGPDGGQPPLGVAAGLRRGARAGRRGPARLRGARAPGLQAEARRRAPAARRPPRGSDSATAS